MKPGYSMEFRQKKNYLAGSVMAMALLIATGAGVIVAQDTSGQTPHSGADSANKEKNVVAGQTEAKRLLLLMDRDKNGNVSKQEFMEFIAAEFELLDKNKDGELDVQELTHTRLTAPPKGAIHS